MRFNLSVPDYRASEIFDRTSLRFLGRFGSSADVEKRFAHFIKGAYLLKGRPIGKNPKGIQAFLEGFAGDLTLSADQAQNLIDTTVSRARIIGQVSGMRSADARTYIIGGAKDNLTCKVCAAMIGRSFSVATAVRWQDSLLESRGADIESLYELLVDRMSVEAIKSSTNAALQAAGPSLALPPFHQSCRDRTVVDTFYDLDDEVPWR